jgi:hypothetical protein
MLKMSCSTYYSSSTASSQQKPLKQTQRRQVALVISSTASATAGHRQRNTTLEPALQRVPLHMGPLTLDLWPMTLQLLQQQEC